MTWGATGPWGAGSPWGTGSSFPPPTLITVSTHTPAPAVPSAAPAVIDTLGGTVLKVIGTNFFADEDAPYVAVDFLTGSLGAYTVVGQGFIFDPDFDVTRNRIWAGSPPLEVGLYHLRVTTPGGATGVLENAIASRVHAGEHKVHTVRGKWMEKWNTGPRRLR